MGWGGGGGGGGGKKNNEQCIREKVKVKKNPIKVENNARDSGIDLSVVTY